MWVGHSGPVDQLRLLSWVNSVAGAKGLFKGPLASKAGKVDSGYFVGALTGRLGVNGCPLEISDKDLCLLPLNSWHLFSKPLS